jgi:hypothetical protein
MLLTLVIYCDGTNNKLRLHKMNIVRLLKVLERNADQLVHCANWKARNARGANTEAGETDGNSETSSNPGEQIDRRRFHFLQPRFARIACGGFKARLPGCAS